ncbi:hypothetical protein [Glutamicibacter sp. X7]
MSTEAEVQDLNDRATSALAEFKAAQEQVRYAAVSIADCVSAGGEFVPGRLQEEYQRARENERRCITLMLEAQRQATEATRAWLNGGRDE